MRRRKALILLAAATGATGIVLMPARADAAVACGQSITTSTTLTSDLFCPGNGLFITAPNVVLDLGGHTISGTKPDGSFFTGVSVTTGRSNVTVRNGTIRGFNRGVAVLPRANNALLTDLVVDNTDLGIATFTNTQTGEVPEGARIVSNRITNTSRFSAMQLGGNRHTVQGNTITNGASTGVFLFGHDNLVASNSIIDSGASGLLITNTPSTFGPFLRNRLTGNQISGSSRVFNSPSINVNNGADTVVEGNSATGRFTTPGVFVFNSAGTLVSGNRLIQNNEGVLVRGSSTNTRVSGNSALNNNNGIVIESGTTGNLIERNQAVDNRFDGIRVSSPSSTLTANTAYRNGGFGIRAVSGVTDGGGNRAFLNGAGQCTPNIACA